MLDFKWAIINNLPLRTIADSLVKGLRVTEALPEAAKQVIPYFCYSAIEFYFLKVLKSINQFPRSWSGPGLAKTLRSERGEMTHYKCTSGHGASKRLIFWFFNVYERGGITCIWCFACRGRGVACFPNVFQVSAGNTEYGRGGGLREWRARKFPDFQILSNCVIEMHSSTSNWPTSWQPWVKRLTMQPIQETIILPLARSEFGESSCCQAK